MHGEKARELFISEIFLFVCNNYFINNIIFLLLIELLSVRVDRDAVIKILKLS